ncbi:hypothetical protein ES703_89624 [subsurface metagenome]
MGILSPNLVPWAWGINGCVSVLSSILSLMIALWLGFSWVLMVAAGSYLVGTGIACQWMKRVRQSAQEEKQSSVPLT